MAPSKKSTKTETPVQESQAPVKKSTSKKTEAAPVKTETKKAPSKKTDSKQTEKKVDTPAPVKTPRKKVEKKEESPEQVEEVEKQPAGPRVKRTVNKESFDIDCTKFSDMILAEISKLRESDQKPKSKGIRLLRTLHKVFRQLHKDGNKLTKFKKNSVRKNNTSSGFLKPVLITAEMAKFLGWDVNKKYSRTQVTKEICDYIAKHSLNDPENKRNINCDVKLKTLLKYDAASAPKDEETGKALPLTYFRLQQYLKHHFIKPVEEEAELDE